MPCHLEPGVGGAAYPAQAVYGLQDQAGGKAIAVKTHRRVLLGAGETGGIAPEAQVMQHGSVVAPRVHEFHVLALVIAPVARLQGKRIGPHLQAPLGRYL